MSEEIIYAKVDYFIDYWKDFTYSNSIEEELTHTIVYNPKELFKEFADEISRKELKNKDNKKFFIDHINRFFDFKIESTNYLNSTLTLIKQQFQNPDFKYLLHLLSILDKLLSNNKLVINCVNELEAILTSKIELDDSFKEKIKILTKLIIFELIYKKYSLQFITKIIDNIFDNYSIDQNGILCTDFPHNFEIDFNTKVDSLEFQQYQDKIENLINNLTLNQRILSIKNYFNQQPKQLTYIFQIKGLKGNIDATFGNVRIYNPKNAQLITKCTKNNIPYDELFNGEKFIYCNGAVTLDVIDREYAKQEAIRLLSQTIDSLVTLYDKYKLPIDINLSNILICDQEGNERGFSSKNDSIAIKYNNSIEINDSDNDNIKYLLDFYNYKPANQYSIVDTKLLESLHWRRRAIESLNNNEKILWYWISIENIIGDTNTIFNTVSKFLAITQLYSFTWKHYEKLDAMLSLSPFCGNFKKRLEISHELQQKLGFGLNKPGFKVYLTDFIENISNIQNSLNKNELLYDQLDHLTNVFDTSKKCL